MKALKRYLRQPLGVIGAALAVVLLLTAALGPWLAPYDTGTADYSQQWRPPGRTHWMGTEFYGVDVLSRIIAGARMTLAIGLGAAARTITSRSPGNASVTSTSRETRRSVRPPA